MQFKAITFIVASAIATGSMASPLGTANPAEVPPHTQVLKANNYTELYREPASASGGHLVYYGPTDNSKMLRSEAIEIEERASCNGNGVPTCATDHTARNGVCDALITELGADSQVKVDESPRQICYESDSAGSNEYCCVSWSKKASNLIKGDLYNYANTILQKCTTSGVSGKVYKVTVEGTCTDVCLSNRGTGC